MNPNKECLLLAIKLGLLHFISWWKYKQYSMNISIAYDEAARYGHIDIIV